jgi:hypothetical protein
MCVRLAAARESVGCRSLRHADGSLLEAHAPSTQAPIPRIAQDERSSTTARPRTQASVSAAFEREWSQQVEASSRWTPFSNYSSRQPVSCGSPSRRSDTSRAAASCRSPAAEARTPHRGGNRHTAGTRCPAVGPVGMESHTRMPSTPRRGSPYRCPGCASQGRGVGPLGSRGTGEGSSSARGSRRQAPPRGWWRTTVPGGSCGLGEGRRPG